MALATLVVSCGSDDDSSTVAEATVPSADSVVIPGEDAPAEPVSDGGDPVCSDIFSDDEIEEFFTEPAELTENDVVTGVLQCTWETIEDADDLEDLALQTIWVQFYSGPTIDASTVFNQTTFEPVATITDVGDEAWVSEAGGVAKQYIFIDGDTAGMLMYQEINMGGSDDVHSDGDAEVLFRTFHDRVS